MKDFKVMILNRLKIGYLLELIILILSLDLFAAEKKVINVGYFVVPTFIYENDKKEIVGPVYQFIKSIEKISNYQFVFEKFPLTRLLHEVETGYVQMMAMAAKQSENESLITNETPFFKDKSYLIARKDFKYNKITSVKQLENYVIGIKQDGAINSFLLANKDKIKFETSASSDSINLALSKLLGNRVDLIHSYSSHIYLYLARKNKQIDKIKPVELPGDLVEVYFGFSKKLAKKDRDNLNKLINYLLLEKKVNLTEQIKNWED